MEKSSVDNVDNIFTYHINHTYRKERKKMGSKQRYTLKMALNLQPVSIYLRTEQRA